MSFSLHAKQTIADGLHSIVAYRFANSTVRLATTGFVAEDLYKVAIQDDDQSLWILTSVDPIVWTSMQASNLAVGGDLDGYINNAQVTNMHISGQANGDMLYYQDGYWRVLPAGNDGYFLQFKTTGGSSKPAWGVLPVATNVLTNINISAGTTSSNLSNLIFSNGGGLTWGLSNGSILTATVIPGAAAGLGAAQAGTQTQTSGTIVFSNSNGISFGMSNSSVITASYTVPTQTAYQFSNSNGISFGTNGSTVTASYTVPNVPAQTNQTIGGYAAGNTIGQSSSSTFDARSLSISGAGAASVGYSNNQIIVSVQPSIANINISAGTTSNNLTNAVFSNSNNISFGLNGSTVTASASFPTQTNQTVGVYAASNTTGQSSSSTYDARSLTVQGAGAVSVGNSGGSIIVSSPIQTAFQLSNSNGISFGTNGSTVTASYTVPTQTSLNFSNSNNVSFGLNGSTLTATATFSQSNQTIGAYAVGNTNGQSSSSTFDARSLTIKGNGGLTVGYSNGSILLDVNTAGGGALTNINISAGTTSNNLSAIVFSNSNGLAFGLNGSTVTGSYTVPTQTAYVFSNSNGISFGTNGSTVTASYTVPNVPAQTNQSVGLYALGNTTQNSSTTLDARSISFNGLGGATVGYSNGSVQISAPTTANLISRINVSAGTTSNNLTALTFADANGLAFGLNGSVVTGSYTLPTQSNQTEGFYAVGNTTGQSSSTTLDARSLTLNGAGIISVGYSNSSVLISANQSVQSQNVVVPSAGTQTATSGTVVFSNSNGISFGMSNSSVITASYTVPTQTNQSVGLYALGNTTQNSSTTLDARSLSFNGLGAATLGYSNGSIQVSVPVQSAQTQSNIQAIYDGANSISTGTIRFSNSNGISFGINGQTLTASHNAITSQTNQSIGLYAVSNTTGQSSSSTFDARSISFAGSGGASVGYSNGSVIINAGAAGGASSAGLYATGNTTQNSSTTLAVSSLLFNGLGGNTIGYSNGSIQISGVTTNNLISGINVSAGTTSNNTTAFVLSNSNGVSFGLNAGTITASVQPGPAAGIAAIQASTATQTSGTVVFTGSGIANISYNNGTVIVSVPAAGASVNISAGTTSNNLGALTFADGNGVSFGLNGSTLTASISQSNQTVGLYALGNTTQNSSTTRDARSLSFNGLGAATVGYSNGSIQVSVPVQTSFQLSNSNGISFGTNGSTVTASYTVPTQTNQSVGLYALGNTTQNSSTTLDARSLSFNGLGAATLGYSNGSIQVSVPVQTAYQFSNSNGISFGTNGSTVTASYTVPNVPAQTNQTEGFYAIGNTIGQSSSSTFDARTLSISGAGIASVGYSGNALVVSVPAGAQVNISAGTISNNLTALTFANANNVSFGLNASTVTASASFPAQTNQTVGLYALGNTTQNSSTTLDARTLSFNGLGAATVGYSNGSIQISVPTQTAQTQNIVVPSAGTQTATSGTVVWSNSNNITFGMSGSSRITASYNFNLSAGTTSNNLNAVTFADANGLAFGLNAGTVTGSYTVPTQTNQTVGLYALGNTTQNSSTTLDARSLSFNGLGAATLGYSNGSIQVSVPVQTSLSFSNANNVSFGLNGSTLTATATFAQTNQTEGFYAVGNTTGQSSSSTFDARTVSLNGAGIISVGYSNSSVLISATQSAQTQNVVVPSAGTQTATSGTVVFSNSNGISFGMSNSSVITASYTVPTQTNQSIGLYALGNTTQNSSTTLDARTLSFNGLGGNTVGYSNGSIQISGVTTNNLISAINISAGTTSNNLTAITFSNSNGLAFGLNGSTITGSYTVPTQTNQTIGAYAVGNTTGQSSSSTFDARTISFSGAGIASVGYSGNNIVISVPSAGANINVSAGTTSNNLNAITFSNANGVSFGLNASTLTASVSQSNQVLSMFALGNTTQNSSSALDARSLSFNGLGAATIGYSNGSIQISVPVQSAQTQSNIQAIYDGANSISTGTIRFSNSNGISFGINGQTVTASHNGITSQTNQSIGLYAVSNTTAQSSSSTFDARSISFAGSGNISVGYSGGSVIIAQTGGGVQSNQTLGLYALGNTTQNSSTTLDARTLSFNGLGGATVGYSNGSIQMSVPATSSLSVTGGLSMSINGNTISLGVPPVAVSQFVYPDSPWQTNFTISNAGLSLQHVNFNNGITATQANLLMALSGNTNSSGALTISLGLFTMSGSTLSLVSSNSRQISWTSGSQTTASSIFGGVSGTRYRTIGLNTWSISAGDYMLGVWFRTTNNGTWLAFGQQGPTIVGAVDANETNAYLHGFSTSSFTTAMVGSINSTNTNYVRTGANAWQQPGFIMLGTI